MPERLWAAEWSLLYQINLAMSAVSIEYNGPHSVFVQYQASSLLFAQHQSGIALQYILEIIVILSSQSQSLYMEAFMWKHREKNGQQAVGNQNDGSCSQLQRLYRNTLVFLILLWNSLEILWLISLGPRCCPLPHLECVEPFHVLLQSIQ